MAVTNKKKKETPSLPRMVYAEASVRSVGGDSLFDVPELVTSDTVPQFYSESQLVSSAVERLRTEGFDILEVGPATVTIGAAPKVYNQVFKTKIFADEREAIKEFGAETTATFIECPDTGMPGLIDTAKSSLSDVLEGVALNEPMYYFASAFPPSVGYWHMDVPADISLGLNADRAHRAGITGKGAHVAMVDSGWYRHPFFTQRGYRARSVVLGPGASAPDHDEHGHGTGESANIFAAAPDATFTMIKMSFVNSVGAFIAAMRLRPDVITCSWGSSKKNPPLSATDLLLSAVIAYAVRQGITVVFSAGNGHWGFPGQHPDVISAGGAYMHENGSFEATPYASGFKSNIYRGRTSPDLCGLVGLPSGDPVPGRSPGAMYIMLPVEPKNYLDAKLQNQGRNHYRSAGARPPYGDETEPDDGWALFSGTSAAAPQIAGICALMKQACPRLSPARIKRILKKTARDVTTGSCAISTGGHPASFGEDTATGSGLADAARAAIVARLQNIIVWPPRRRPLAPTRAVRPLDMITADGGADDDDLLDEEMAELEDMILNLQE
jgi:subtilisin family serine protease